MTATPESSDGAAARPVAKSAAVGTALLCALAYFVLVGGTARGEVDSVLRLVNGLIGGAAIGLFVVRARSGSDRIDLAMIAAVVAFSLAGVFSTFPRQSFDAVLAALAYGAAFSVARRELRGEDARRRLVMVFIALSVVLTLLTAARWLGPILEWWAGTGWSVIPPLSFELSGAPWGHRHDLTLLVVLLYPAWWIGHPSGLRRVGAIVIGVLVLLIVLVDASRAVWLGIAAASVLVALPLAVRGWRSSGGFRIAVITMLTVAAIGAIVTGIGPSLWDRATSLATVDYRTAMWGPLFADWLDHPIAGNGPGSFPWILQLTDYFDTNSWAPRHPDSAVVMAMAEGGVLGLAALAILVVGLGLPILRSRSIAARWALVTFAVTSLLANPTDFAFLVVVAIAWAAYALPFESPGVIEASWRPRVVGVATLVLLAVIGIGYSAMAVASVAYDRARGDIGRGDLEAASSALGVATTLDPSMAIYVRQRGAVAYMQGDFSHAIGDLERATRLNSSDDLAWRQLALARLAAEEAPAADAAVSEALDHQRSDPTNLLLAARAASGQGDTEGATELLAEVLQARPATAFAIGWDDVLPSSATTDEVLARAIERWEDGAPMPELPNDQPLWLALMAGRDNLLEAASSESGWSSHIDDALVHVMRCGDAAAVFDRMDPAEQRTYFYWWLTVADAQRHGSDHDHAERMAALMGSPLSIEAADATLNPMNENGSFSADAWGYRRRATVWPQGSDELPSSDGGMMRWIYRAGDSVDSAGLTEQLPDC